MADQKMQQLKEVQAILTNVKFEKSEFNHEEILEELKSIVHSMLKCYSCQEDTDLTKNLMSLLNQKPFFQECPFILSEIIKVLTTEESMEITTLKLDLLTNLLKLHLFSLLGPIDPAEKQVIKQKYAMEGLEEVKARFKTMETYNQLLGGYHPHTDLFKKRADALEKEVERRSNLTDFKDLHSI